MARDPCVWIDGTALRERGRDLNSKDRDQAGWDVERHGTSEADLEYDHPTLTIRGGSSFIVIRQNVEGDELDDGAEDLFLDTSGDPKGALRLLLSVAFCVAVRDGAAPVLDGQHRKAGNLIQLARTIHIADVVREVFHEGAAV